MVIREGEAMMTTETCEAPHNETPVEQADRKWVRQYVIVLQIGAALIAAVAVVFFVIGMIDVTRGTAPALTSIYFVATVAWMLAHAMVPLVLSLLLRYVFGPSPSPGWILRNGAWAFFVAAGADLLLLISSTAVMSKVPQVPVWRVFLYSPQVLVGALVWVALGLVLRRVLPIIEESKTLV
jgi:hypothetical protein